MAPAIPKMAPDAPAAMFLDRLMERAELPMPAATYSKGGTPQVVVQDVDTAIAFSLPTASESLICAPTIPRLESFKCSPRIWTARTKSYFPAALPPKIREPYPGHRMASKSLQFFWDLARR